jgi:hypothetical protein
LSRIILYARIAISDGYACGRNFLRQVSIGKPVEMVILDE